MTHPSPRELDPAAAARQAALGGAVAFLGRHRKIRALFGAAGAGLLLLGLLTAPLWNVPLLSWLLGGQVAAVSLASGVGALGIWHLSGSGVSGARGGTGEETGPCTRDLLTQLERLEKLRAAGAVTDEEFELIKSRLLR